MFKFTQNDTSFRNFYTYNASCKESYLFLSIKKSLHSLCRDEYSVVPPLLQLSLRQNLIQKVSNNCHFTTDNEVNRKSLPILFSFLAPRGYIYKKELFFFTDQKLSVSPFALQNSPRHRYIFYITFLTVSPLPKSSFKILPCKEDCSLF